MQELAWINGTVSELAAASIPLEDRGFFFGDGVYESIRIYNGKPFRLEDHLQRLRRSAAAIMLDLADLPKLEAAAPQLIKESGCPEAYLYIQLTRGVAPRSHLFPAGVKPTMVMYVRTLPPGFGEAAQNGVACITVPDERWLRCNIKTINLLPNVLAKEKARRAGAYEAIFYRPGGVVTEGSSTNVFAVCGGVIYTHPESNLILSGITRQVILELLPAAGLPFKEEAVSLEQLRRAEEIWISSSTAEIVPVISLDGKPVGDGKVGALAREVRQRYRAAVQDCCG
ncbi:MAG TPA: D-amino-acid transaminase [Bacillota bacterium]|nr:D-amino-acid transaminase [Bacillota bacterium]